MFEEDIPKYKKRSNKNGQPRSKHKHTYETVLLTTYYKVPDMKTGKTTTRSISLPTKVCTICGRINNVDRDESYYELTEIQDSPYRVHEKKLSAKALSLPKWYAPDFISKFAIITKEMDDDKV